MRNSVISHLHRAKPVLDERRNFAFCIDRHNRVNYQKRQYEQNRCQSTDFKTNMVKFIRERAQSVYPVGYLLLTGVRPA